ncbi:alpha/beta hydrolase [Saccharomonospora sp. CUA-673]|uniref:alpha/beta fold hydrolase n=1 Tax=Saccharomonospora sp. CUA-673 TaxID=1904969 RepID=UPI000967BF04|nr:alpha/beta fold hydrolase [Saccharomonospora sp. CUA-673]OLT38466.1 alpha/beta hydrolase [Saccharomonospora sp. CUA-673]
MPHASAADGTALHYRVQGRSDDAAATLVLIAGQSNGHRWWDAALADFTPVFRVLTMDHRGIGDSDKPDDDSYSIEQFAADVVTVLDAADVERAHVYGTSMGGRIAQRLAAAHPSRVDRLVLGCTSPGGPHAVERDEAVGRSLTQYSAKAVRRALLELMYTPEWLAENPGPYRTIGERDTPQYVLRKHRIASARHDAWDDLPTITAPTLVVHGEDDVFNPAANAALLAERIPGARLELIPGARHAYFEERRDVAGPLVVDFLTE